MSRTLGPKMDRYFLSLEQLIRKVHAPLASDMCQSAALIQPPPILFEFSSATPSLFDLPVSPALVPLEPKFLVNTTEQPSPVVPLQPTRRSGLHFKQNDTGVTFKDEAFAQEVTDRVVQLISIAMTPDSSSVNTQLARKALKYRNIDLMGPRRAN